MLPTETRIVDANTGHHKFYSSFPAPIVVRDKVVAAENEEGCELLAQFPSLAENAGSDAEMRELSSSSRAPKAKAKAKASSKAKPSPGPSEESDFRAEAKSLKHLMTHIL